MPINRIAFKKLDEKIARFALNGNQKILKERQLAFEKWNKEHGVGVSTNNDKKYTDDEKQMLDRIRNGRFCSEEHNKDAVKTDLIAFYNNHPDDVSGYANDLPYLKAQFSKIIKNGYFSNNFGYEEMANLGFVLSKGTRLGSIVHRLTEISSALKMSGYDRVATVIERMAADAATSEDVVIDDLGSSRQPPVDKDIADKAVKFLNKVGSLWDKSKELRRVSDGLTKLGSIRLSEVYDALKLMKDNGGTFGIMSYGLKNVDIDNLWLKLHQASLTFDLLYDFILHVEGKDVPKSGNRIERWKAGA